MLRQIAYDFATGAVGTAVIVTALAWAAREPITRVWFGYTFPRLVLIAGGAAGVYFKASQYISF